MHIEICSEGMRLLSAYKTALADTDTARSHVKSLVSQEGLKKKVEIADTLATLLRARRAYWRHVEVHRCRGRERQIGYPDG